jgi:hypothetical protein
MTLPASGDAVALDDLHPTQLTLGMEEVAERLAKYLALSAEEQSAKAAEKAVPHVIGPAGVIYMIDHHHFCRVLWEAGARTAVLGPREGDLSHLDETAFWAEMLRRDWCWPIDRYGNRRPPALIPDHVSQLPDNPWRSFARSLRGKAFADEDSPFQEFRWGEYFRGFLTERLITEHPGLARRFAKKLAPLDQAQDLPGWRPDEDD